MSMSLVFTQILVILLYVLVGFASGKLRLINPEQRRYLSGLCSTLILPFTILSASSQQLGGKEMTGMLVVLGFTLALYACVTALSPEDTAFSAESKSPAAPRATSPPA